MRKFVASVILFSLLELNSWSARVSHRFGPLGDRGLKWHRRAATRRYLRRSEKPGRRCGIGGCR